MGGLMIQIARWWFAAVIGLALSATTLAANSYTVVLDTSNLKGRTPFSIALQLTDAGATGDANNTVTVSAVNFGGGAPTGSPTTLGGAAGSLVSSVTLTDSLFLNYFIQQFVPGSQLTFQVTATNTADAGGGLDQFSFSILDGAGQELPTVAGQPFYNPIAALALGSPGSSLQTYAFSNGPISVAPASGMGASQPMTVTFSDPIGWQDFDVVNILVNNALDGRQACYLAYSQPLNALYLVGDTGNTLLPGAVLSSSGNTKNSQCTVNWANSPVAGNGNSLALTLNVAFSGSFAGNKVVYLAAGNLSHGNSGWRPLGVWQVPGATSGTTAVVGMSPSRGSGTNQTAFTFTFSDTKGVSDLGVQNILVNNGLDGRHACYVAYARPINMLYLVNDNGDGLLPGQSLNSAGSLSNSQCAVGWGTAPVTVSGNNVSLNLTMAFSPAFGGNRVFYLASRDSTDANNSGWQAMGTWTVQ